MSIRSVARIWALLLVILASPSFAATVDQWRQGIDTIVSDIRTFHPNPFGRVGEREFVREAEDIKDDLPELTEEQRTARVMHLVALLGDGHSWIGPTSESFALWYPFIIYDFEDGYFLTAAYGDSRGLAGAQVLEIAGRPASEVADAARGLLGADNRFDRCNRLYVLHNAPLMRALGYARADGSLDVRLRLASGQTDERRISPLEGAANGLIYYGSTEFRGPIGAQEDWISAYRGLNAFQIRQEPDVSRPLHLRERYRRTAIVVPDRDAYYIQVNHMGSEVDGENLVNFFRRVLADVDERRPRSLILDLRYNPGGDGSLVPSIMVEFIKRKDDPPWTDFYVLTGRTTFSAAISFTAELIKYMHPTLVGEPMGAPLNFYGDTATLDYPDIGMQAHISSEFHQLARSSDVSRFVPVHYPARFSFADYVAGRDPAVDAILSADIDARSIPVIASADGADRAMEIFESRRSSFGDSWIAPSHADFSPVIRDFVDRNALQQASEVALVNARINASEWRPWDTLGDIYWAMGRRDDAVEAYQASLDLNDPTNFNAGRVTELIANYREEQSEAQQ